MSDPSINSAPSLRLVDDQTTKSHAASEEEPNSGYKLNELLWALGSISALHKQAFDPRLVAASIAPGALAETLVSVGRQLGFRVQHRKVNVSDLNSLPLPAIAVVGDSLCLLAQCQSDQVTLFVALSNEAKVESKSEFGKRFSGEVFLFAPNAHQANDPDAMAAAPKSFGFNWFVPELLKHRKVWRDVLAASFILQLLALATPLFTQAIIDKVVVHRTQSTLMAIAVGMLVFMIFTALLTWVRQYLVLHTGNRVDAVLGATVFEHLFKLPPRYFELRPTGVVAARLHGVETIREFVSSAAVSLVLDIPFLLICLGVMFYYSVPLTLITLAMLGLIVIISAVAAPMFQRRLNEQFLLGARNQAFVTEYVAGVETVKSLQMESVIQARYGDFMAQYLKSSFATKQMGNTYNVVANTLEQMMTLMVLIAGAFLVMNPTHMSASMLGQETGVFTIGMLVAFQMFAGKLSQPVLRIVGLWQQFQQASLAVARLGDVMNAPTEPYSLLPGRLSNGPGRFEVRGLAFRYSEQHPLLYQNLSFTIEPGQVVALMGASGSGKSTHPSKDHARLLSAG